MYAMAVKVGYQCCEVAEPCLVHFFDGQAECPALFVEEAGEVVAEAHAEVGSGSLCHCLSQGMRSARPARRA